MVTLALPARRVGHVLRFSRHVVRPGHPGHAEPLQEAPQRVGVDALHLERRCHRMAGQVPHCQVGGPAYFAQVADREERTCYGGVGDTEDLDLSERAPLPVEELRVLVAIQRADVTDLPRDHQVDPVLANSHRSRGLPYEEGIVGLCCLRHGCLAGAVPPRSEPPGASEGASHARGCASRANSLAIRSHLVAHLSSSRTLYTKSLPTPR